MSEAFDWTVRPQDWPPVAEVKPPYSLTRVEVARSCPLRVVFEVSRKYEPLTSFDARIGTAMHETLEHFARHPLSSDDPALLSKVGDQFQARLQAQRQEAQARPRERLLPENQERIDAALQAVLRAVKAGEVAAAHGGRSSKENERVVVEDGRTIWVERQVKSKDGQFLGRVDQAIKDEGSLTVYDFKSSMHATAQERYTRQVQMYTEMWEATTGERPTRGVLVYPMLGKEFPVDISPQATRETLKSSYQAVQVFNGQPSPESLARPGDVCKICSFKPWCQPFWNWVTEGSLPTCQERSAFGFQGEVKETGRHKEYLMLKVQWHPRSVGILLIPWGLLAHAQALQPGQTIRVTGCRMVGQVTSPRAMWQSGAELFVVAG